MMRSKVATLALRCLSRRACSASILLLLSLELGFALLLFAFLFGLVLRHALLVLGFALRGFLLRLDFRRRVPSSGRDGRLLRLLLVGHAPGNACPCKRSTCGQAACRKRRWQVWRLRTASLVPRPGCRSRFQAPERGRAARLRVAAPWDCASRSRSGRGRDGLQSPGQGMPQPCCGSSLNRGTGRETTSAKRAVLYPLRRGQVTQAPAAGLRVGSSRSNGASARDR